MPRTHDVGRAFWHVLVYPSTRFPVLDKGYSHEIEPPYRRATSIVLRAPFSKHALVIGRWGQPEKKPDEHALLLRALDGREMGRYSEWDG